MEGFLTEHRIWLQVLIILGALGFGFWQILINKRLKKLQDYVAISVVPGQQYIEKVVNGKLEKVDVVPFIKVLNTGKLNVYIHKFELPGNCKVFKEPRMIPASAGDSSYYWLPLPKKDALTQNEEFKIVLFLTDQHNKKYISINGGILDGDQVKFWTIKTRKKKWRI